MPAAQQEPPGTCTYPIRGCTVEGSLNYDSTASILEGCVHAKNGCTDSTASNFASLANTFQTRRLLSGIVSVQDEAYGWEGVLGGDSGLTYLDIESPLR